MLSCALFFLLLAGVWAQKCRLNEGAEVGNYQNHAKCVYCSYNGSESVKPEVLWVTSRSAFLRARVCGCWCSDKILWYFRNVKTNKTASKAEPWDRCNSKEYCEITGSAGSTMLISLTFYNYNIMNVIPPIDGTYVHLCPNVPPPRPRDVMCRKLENQPQLRWIYKYELEDLKCFSYTQFVVLVEGVRGISGWHWLGEASPTLSSFGGQVHRCPDNPDFLCANLSIKYAPLKLKLGARRNDADEDSEVNSTEFVPCEEYKDKSTLPWQTTDLSSRVPAPDPAPTAIPDPAPHPTAVLVPQPASGVECPAPSPVPSNPPMSASPPADLGRRSGMRHHASCDGWNTIALVALVALLVCVALLPLAYLAGRRSRKKKQLDVSWQQLQDDRSERNGMHGSSTTVFGERPPQYEYDYAGLLPLRSPLPPPLPAQPPPLPALPPPQLPPLPTVPPPRSPQFEEHYKEVHNDIYNSVD